MSMTSAYAVARSCSSWKTDPLAGLLALERLAADTLIEGTDERAAGRLETVGGRVETVAVRERLAALEFNTGSAWRALMACTREIEHSAM